MISLNLRDEAFLGQNVILPALDIEPHAPRPIAVGAEQLIDADGSGAGLAGAPAAGDRFRTCGGAGGTGDQRTRCRDHEDNRCFAQHFIHFHFNTLGVGLMDQEFGPPPRADATDRVRFASDGVRS